MKEKGLYILGTLLMLLMIFSVSLSLHDFIVLHKIQAYKFAIMFINMYSVIIWAVMIFRKYRKKNRVVRQTDWNKLYL